MAKKWSKKEINEYLGTKQISQENYVAPTVQTNYTPSVENTVQAFNSVEPTIKSVEPTIKSVESTVQPTATQETTKPKEEKKGFSFSIDKKKKTSDDAWKEYTDAKDNMKAYQQEKGINFFNRYNKKNENDKEYQRLLNETKNKYAEYYKLDQEEKNKERGGVFDAFKDGYNFGDVTKTIGNIIEKNIIDPAYSIAESASIDPKSTLKTGGIGALSGLEESNKTTERALNDFFKNKKADTGIQSLNVNDFNRLVEYGTPEQKQQYLEMLNQDYADKKINNKMYNYYKNALTQEDTRSETTKKINRALNPDYQQSEIYKRYEKGELTPGEQVVFSQGQQIGNQVPVIATSTMFGPTAGKALFFTNAQQNYTEDALQRGYSKEDARKYGLIMGTVETIIEEAGFDEFGGLKNMAKDSVLKAASGEAMEEAVTPYLDYGVRTLFGENYDVDAATQDAVQGAISAAISATIMSGTSKGLTKVDNVANKINNNQQVTSQEMKEAVNELQQNDSKGLKDKIDEYLGKYKELFQNKTNQQQPQIPTQTSLNEVNQGVQEQDNQLMQQQQTPQITPLNQVNQELQETRQNDIANQVQAMNLEKPQKVSLEQQLENRASKIIEDAINTEDGMINNFKNYIEENDITNPTQKDIDDSLVDILGYDNEMSNSEKLELEKQYKETINKYLEDSNFNKIENYQGKNTGSGKATGKNISLDNLYKKVDSLADNMKQDKEAMSVIESVKDNPDAKVKIYRATPGDNINSGDWVFITKDKADRFSKDLFGNKRKIGYKVLEMEVAAKDLDWTGKNLEFEFKPQGENNYKTVDITDLEQEIPKTTTQEKTTQEQPKNEVKQEIKKEEKSYLTKEEQQELDGLKDLYDTGLLEETDSDYKRLQELEKKSQGITKKYPELSKTVTQEDTKPLYFKYKDNEISRENNKILNEAKNIVESNNQGKRTKEQWLQVAEYIGSNADIKSSTDLQKLAMETWLASRPNNRDNLNRQGKKYVDFKTNEWFNAMYKGAGVGTDIKLSKEERNTINESKQDEVAVLRTPTEIQPKEVKTPEQKQEYFEESGTPKKVAKILSETPRETETSSLREKYQTLKRAVVDKGEAIYRIAKQTKNRRLYAMYDRIGLATGEGNSNIGNAQVDLNGKKYENFKDSKGNKTSMSLNDIWEDVEKSGIPENVMNEYLANYLNVDRYKSNQLSLEEQEELKELNKFKNLNKEMRERKAELEDLKESRNVFGEAVTREDSLKKVKEIESQYPQIKRPAENIWQYGKNQLQKMVDAGLVSKESQEYYNENTPHYVRLQRSVDKTNNPIFDSRGSLKVNNQIKKAKGGTKDIIPFKDSMAQYTLDTTSSIRKNLFGQELSKTLQNGLDIDGNIDIDNVDSNILNKNDDGSYTFTIFEDGNPKVLTIDKGIYEALQPNKHYEMEKLFTPFKAISNFKRTVLTDKNPLFLATNFFKDFFDAPLNTKHSTVDFVKNYGKAIKEISTNGDLYQQYLAMGGNQNTYFDKEGFKKDSKIEKVFAPIEKANNFIEMLPRLSEFITSVEKGESLDEAMYNAAEITTNFKRGGTATKIVNRNGATFLNASVQGFDKQIRNFTEIQNPKQAVRLMTKALVLGVAPALLNAVMYDDDDEYDDLPDYVKDSYYLFKTGKDNKWIRIPKGRAISVIQSAARRTYDYSKGNKEAYKGLAGHFENQLAPNNPLESNVLSPFIDVKNNKAWSGNKIVSDSIANTSHPEEEYDAKTDELSKWLGQKLGKSPKKINYIIDQNTGAIGDLLLPFLTKQAEGEDDSVAGRLLKNPVKDKFTTDAVLNSKQVNQFYDAFNKAEDDKKWSKATDEDKLKYKYLYSTMLDLAEKNKQIKEIESSDKSDKEKYRETKAIKQEMNDMSKKAVKESENIKINDYYAQIDDKVYKKEYDKSTGEYKYTKVQQKQLDKIKDKGVPLSDYFREAYEKQKKRATK